MKKELSFSITKKDFEIQIFRAGGKGGQHQNKTDSGVRIIHRASGAVGESRSERSQLTNKRLALKRLTMNPKFKVWMNQKAHEIMTGKTLEQVVEEAMQPKFLKIETRDEKGKWAKYGEAEENN